jgi:RecB family exonuclease
MTAAEVIHLVLRQVSGESVPPPQEPDAVELLGWLELPLDDAPHLFIGGFNEGCVPQAITSDLFLPNRIREHLQIDDDRRRYARDAYALSVLLHSRRTVHLVTARRDADNNPLKPSRLLFATSPENVVTCWQRILDASDETALVGLFDVDDNAFGFKVPETVELEKELTEIRVTDFKLFLECPYRYYLARRLKLRPIEHDFEEMNPAMFGTLAHGVLGRFGNSEFKDLSDPLRIQQVLDEYLDEAAETTFGGRPLTAVQVQIEQMRQRLHYFAHSQARLIDEGWQIHYAEGVKENEDPASVTWHVAGRDVKISGRIDRIDHHKSEDRFRVLDYKTFDSKKAPDKTHRLKDQWIDLQLPLYRHLASEYGVEGTVELGYFIISKTQEATDVACANWDEATLDSADEEARRVISKILNNEFGVPVEPSPNYSEKWDRICLVDVPRR